MKWKIAFPSLSLSFETSGLAFSSLMLSVAYPHQHHHQLPRGISYHHRWYNMHVNLHNGKRQSFLSYYYYHSHDPVPGTSTTPSRLGDGLTGCKHFPMKNCWKFLFPFPKSWTTATWSKINAFFLLLWRRLRIYWCTFIIFLWTNNGKTVAIDKMYIKIYYINWMIRLWVDQFVKLLCLFLTQCLGVSFHEDVFRFILFYFIQIININATLLAPYAITFASTVSCSHINFIDLPRHTYICASEWHYEIRHNIRFSVIHLTCMK